MTASDLAPRCRRCDGFLLRTEFESRLCYYCDAGIVAKEKADRPSRRQDVK